MGSVGSEHCRPMHARSQQEERLAVAFRQMVVLDDYNIATGVVPMCSRFATNDACFLAIRHACVMDTWSLRRVNYTISQA